MECDKLNACVLIPARYDSSRFPGKPLVPLLGKPMILWVAERAAKAVGREHVHIATEDERIAKVVEDAGFGSIMTSSNALTGTDRLAEAAERMAYDIYVNVQGDEPMVDPADIRRCIEIKTQHPDRIINGYCWIGNDEDPTNVNLPKVITNERDELIYMSRAALPAFKVPEQAPLNYKKQVCIYAFTQEELASFKQFGRKSSLESSEDIEILRFLELDRRILMYECRPGSHAVDIREDVLKVEALLEALQANKSFGASL